MEEACIRRHMSETTYNRVGGAEQSKSVILGVSFSPVRRHRSPVSLLVCSFHVSRPIRVSLADRKECRTNTTGFGPEWRSNTWRRKGSKKDW